MPKKSKQETQEEQSKRFLAEVERLVVAGELNPTEANKRMELLSASLRREPSTGGD